MAVRALHEAEIQQRLWADLNAAHSLILPNYAPRGWWECDLWAVTKAGYWTEYEIKLSTADFKADARKSQTHYRQQDGRYHPQEINKHELLAGGSTKGPSRFWFVVPEALVSQLELPDWAGLKVCRCDSQGNLRAVLEKRRAPKLHNQKASEAMLNHVKTICYWRFWNGRNAMQREVTRRLQRLQTEESSV